MDTPRKNLNWLWYFLVLAGLTIFATITLAVYNLRQQLRPETVDAAIALWAAKGPADYVLVYTVKRTSDAGEENDHVVVKVKDGAAYDVLINGLPKRHAPLDEHTMPGLQRAIARNFVEDAEPDRPKSYTRGIFDGKTGSLAWYVHRIMGSRQRVEIIVESLEAKGAKAAAK